MPEQMNCPNCGQVMDRAFVLVGESYWCPKKGALRGMASRERIKTERFADAWRCTSCRLVLFGYA